MSRERRGEHRSEVQQKVAHTRNNLAVDLVSAVRDDFDASTGLDGELFKVGCRGGRENAANGCES